MLYVLFGPDDYSLKDALQRLIRSAVPAEMAELNVTRLTAAEATLDAIRQAAEAVPFLAERRVVVVEHLIARLAARKSRERPGGEAAEAASAGPAGAADRGLAAQLAAYLPRVPERTLLIFVERDAPPKSGPLGKALAEAKAEQRAFPVLAGAPLTRWINERARRIGVSLTDRAGDLLATFIGGDLRTLELELRKLAAYAGPGKQVDVEDVKLLVPQASEANIFELVDAVGQRNRRRALTALRRQLAAGERPERILGMVSRQVRLLLQAKDLVERGASSAAVGTELGLSPYPLRKLLDQIKAFPAARLQAMHRRVLDADLQIKTGQQEPALALLLLVAEVC